MAMTDPWIWKFLVSEVFLVDDPMHGGLAVGLSGVGTVQGTRAC